MSDGFYDVVIHYFDKDKHNQMLEQQHLQQKKRQQQNIERLSIYNPNVPFNPIMPVHQTQSPQSTRQQQQQQQQTLFNRESLPLCHNHIDVIVMKMKNYNQMRYNNFGQYQAKGLDRVLLTIAFQNKSGEYLYLNYGSGRNQIIIPPENRFVYNVHEDQLLPRYSVDSLPYRGGTNEPTDKIWIPIVFHITREVQSSLIIERRIYYLIIDTDAVGFALDDYIKNQTNKLVQMKHQQQQNQNPSNQILLSKNYPLIYGRLATNQDENTFEQVNSKPDEILFVVQDKSIVEQLHQ